MGKDRYRVSEARRVGLDTRRSFKVVFISQGGVGKFSVLNGVEAARGGGGSAAELKDCQSCAKGMD
jgi:hypothetical protein